MNLPIIPSFRLRLRRRPQVQVRRAGVVSWLLCGGCGHSSDVARDADELSAAAVAHAPACPVARELWRGLLPVRLDQNGRPRRRLHRPRRRRWRRE